VNLPLANWRISTAARGPSPVPSTHFRSPTPAAPSHQLLPPANWPPSPPPTGLAPGSPPRSKPGAGRDKTAGGHHPRPVAGCCLRRGATGTPIGPRGLSCRGHPAKGPCRQFPRDLRISQHRTAPHPHGRPTFIWPRTVVRVVSTQTHRPHLGEKKARNTIWCQLLLVGNSFVWGWSVHGLFTY
jgi:hypothetical protein